MSMPKTTFTKMKTRAEVIKKLRLRKGFKYLLIFPRSAGLTAEDLAGLDCRYVDLTFIVESTRGIKVVEIPNKDNE